VKSRKKVVKKMDRKITNVPSQDILQVGEGNNMKKVGVLVQGVLKEVLEKNLITKEELSMLQTREYCNRTFSINYPLLKALDKSENISEQMKDQLGRNRYYKTPITIYGDKYLLCSQWYELQKPNLIKWLDLHS